MKRKFLTLDEQLEYLKTVRNLSYDKEDITTLMREGYFNVITNYKTPFLIDPKNVESKFIDGTCLSNLIALKDFDDAIRILYLEYLVKIEQEVRALTSYLFDKFNNNGETSWEDIQSYNIEDIKITKINALINRIKNDMDNNDNNDINSYLSRHEEIPTWAMIQGISYSTYLIFIKDVKKEVQNELTKIYQLQNTYGIYIFDYFYKIIDLFRELRNKCAHNEKIFDFEFNDEHIDEIVSMELLRKGFKFPENIKLINIIIYLKYFLDDIDYKIFINRLLKELKRLYDKINKNSFYTVLSDLGINSSEMLKIIKNVKIKKSYNF